MAEGRLYVLAYDIAHKKRWRRVFHLMQGYGAWLQFSVFQCQLTPRRRDDLAARLDAEIHHDEDHVVILDLGPAEKPKARGGNDAQPGKPSLARNPRPCPARRGEGKDAGWIGSADFRLVCTLAELNPEAVAKRSTPRHTGS